MAGLEGQPSRSRRNASGATSQRSGASPDLLYQIPSNGTYLDDHAQYYGHSYHDNRRESNEALEDDDESTDDSDLTEKDTKEEPDGDIVPEVRDGIEDQRDVEAGPTLEKSRTTKSGRSAIDPDLVGWGGVEDPRNPKNWSMGQKWAATLIGQSMSPFSKIL